MGPFNQVQLRYYARPRRSQGEPVPALGRDDVIPETAPLAEAPRDSSIPRPSIAGQEAEAALRERVTALEIRLARLEALVEGLMPRAR